jgi:anti-anti-sigma factor
MRIQTRMNGSVFEANLGDSMTFSDSGAFRALLQEVTKAQVSSCVFDLSELRSIDSSGLGMFMIARDEAKKRGWSLTLRAPQQQVLSLLKLAKFDSLLAIRP